MQDDDLPRHQGEYDAGRDGDASTVGRRIWLFRALGLGVAALVYVLLGGS